MDRSIKCKRSNKLDRSNSIDPSSQAFGPAAKDDHIVRSINEPVHPAVGEIAPLVEPLNVSAVLVTRTKEEEERLRQKQVKRFAAMLNGEDQPS